MILSINEEYLNEKIGFEIEMNDVLLNLSITDKLYSINESENLVSRFVGFIKNLIDKLINFIKGAFKKSTTKIKEKTQAIVKAADNTQNKVKQNQKTYVEFDDDMNAEYTMIGQEYMQFILDSFLLSKGNIYNQMTYYLNYFRDPDMNQYRIENEVRQFSINFDMNGYSFIYPKLKIKEYMNEKEELKEFIEEEMDKNEDVYVIHNGKMSLTDYSEITDSMKFFEKALNIILKEIDIAQKNLTTYRKTIDRMEFVSVETVFDVFKVFSEDIVNIVQSNIIACEVINKEIEFRLESMRYLISHVKKS